MTIWDDIAAERRANADVLDGLTDEQWTVPSLCGEWTIRSLAGHMIVPFTVTTAKFGLAMLRARGNFDKANDALACQQARRPTRELAELLRANAESHFTPPGSGPLAPLTDTLIHGQDLRLPLGIEDRRPTERWAQSLAFLVTPAAQRGFVPTTLPSVRIAADDVDLTHGEGDLVTGPAWALSMALTLRPAALSHLRGPGLPALTAWVG
ncbi:MAG: maleylpyruvate isomerase family mycothiol-dependent enzyme [Actinomycetales bacterium]|nr:maleylpyruvate isomerase family mycothiol-dependent enzyme [Actinomycetales bacterium]